MSRLQVSVRLWGRWWRVPIWAARLYMIGRPRLRAETESILSQIRKAGIR